MDDQVTILSGQPANAEGRFAIIVARYNGAVTGSLLKGALGGLRDQGVADDQITVAHVPGAWETPVVAAKLARSQKYHAVICLAAVIRGETTHDKYISQQVSHSLGQVAVETEVPVLFGVLTCDNVEQAIQRSGGTHGNKGREAALAALEMATLMRKC